jgi:hypothetical protein
MSDTGSNPAPSFTTWLEANEAKFFNAVGRAASYVYHDVVAAEKDVTAWKASNPALASITNMAWMYVSSTSPAVASAVGTVTSLWPHIEQALKQLAALDSTVQSGNGGKAA